MVKRTLYPAQEVEILAQAVARLEEASGIELAVALVPRCGAYSAVAHWLSAGFTLLVYAFLMFIHIEFSVEFIFLATIAAYMLPQALLAAVQPLKMPFIKGAVLHRQAELNARALFQKNRLNETHGRIGVLLQASKLERLVVVVPDVGAVEHTGSEYWQKLEAELTETYRKAGANAPSALAATLLRHEAFMAQAIPAPSPNLNELPDFLAFID